ncbi:uncharacterized protein TNCV_3067131 [Trichonephila clavipes]|nr:uncharacterized protein TNCV_3067131 [Trichonephila clavipes]
MPFKKLEKRLARGDPGINRVDKSCKKHDIAYRERQARVLIKPIIKAKKTFGMGYKMKCIKCKKETNFKNIEENTSKNNRRYIVGFLGKRNYWDYCQVSYKRENEHKCPLKCDRCFRFESNCEGEEIQWDDCFRSFKGRRCLRNHKYKPKKADGSKKASVCEVLYKCLKCKRILNKIKRKPEDHVCGERLCDNCREWVDKDRKCYMKMKNAKGGLCEYSCSKMGKERLCVCCKKTEACLKTCQKLLKHPDWCDQCKYGDFSEKYFFFYVETMQETGKHKVNLVVNHDFKGNKMTSNDEEEYCKWLLDGKHEG